MFKQIMAVGLIGLSFNTWAEWQLVPERSSLNFVSIKKSSIGEIHTFKSVSGEIKGQTASIEVDLSSVDTGIEIRDERMKEHLFKVDQFGTCVISATLPEDFVKNLKKAEPSDVELTLSISMHGKTVEQSAWVTATKLGRKEIVVTTKQPLIISSADFGFEAGVDKLMSLAGLPSISYAVPVTASFSFEK